MQSYVFSVYFYPALLITMIAILVLQAGKSFGTNTTQIYTPMVASDGLDIFPSHLRVFISWNNESGSCRNGDVRLFSLHGLFKKCGVSNRFLSVTVLWKVMLNF